MTTANNSDPEHGVFCVGWNLAASLNTPGALYIEQDRLVFRALWREWLFPRTSIRSLRVESVLFWSVIRIGHSIPKYARFDGFRPYDFPEVQRRLADAGFHVGSAKA